MATIPLDADVKEADRLGVPLVDHAPDSAGARVIREIIERIEAPA